MRTLQVRIGTKRRIITAQARKRQRPFGLTHRAIVGIHVDGQPLVKFPEHLCDGEDPRVDTFQMPYNFAMRLATFARRHYQNGVSGFDCFSFASYVTGLQRESTMQSGFTEWGNIVQNGRLQPFKPYVIMQTGAGASGELHCVVGFTPTICLNVLGMNQSLLFAATTDIMTLYGANTIAEIGSVR